MGSIATPLRAFAEHCDRTPLTKRPRIFVRYVDMWGEPRGEIGIADPDDTSHTVFALLTPWALVPTMGEACMIVDQLETLEVTRLHANIRGMFTPHWSVPYSMDDRGRLSFGEPEPGLIPTDIGLGLMAATKARSEQQFWEYDHSFESILPVVEGMLNR